MTVIYAVVFTKGLWGFSGLAIGGMVGLDILFLYFISVVTFCIFGIARTAWSICKLRVVTLYCYRSFWYWISRSALNKRWCYDNHYAVTAMTKCQGCSC